MNDDDVLDPKSDEDLLKRMRLQFTAAAEDEKRLREAFTSDLKFASPDGDGQWDPQIKMQREMAKRPAMSFPRCHTFVRQVANDAREKKPTIKFSPRLDQDKDTAEILEGIARFIQYDSEAQVAYETAIDYSAGGSFGYYRFLTEYANDDNDDLNLKIMPVLDPLAVYGILVPACFRRKPKYAFVIEDMAKDDFKREYPDSELASLSWTEAEKGHEGWVGDNSVRIAEYWWVIEEKVKGKRRPQVTVMTLKTNGFEVLDDTKTEWPGSCIPIIPVLGTQMIIEGKPHLFSVVRPQKGAQQLINYYKTRIAETITTSPVSPWIAAAGQISGSPNPKAWQTANTNPVAVLEYNPIDIEGRPAPAPQRQTFEPPIASLSAATAQEIDDMKATTGIFDASLGAQSNETSGKAIFARQQQANLSTMHYLDNLGRSFKQAGDIIAEIVPKIYDTVREIEILGEDEAQKVVTINKQYEVSPGKLKHYKVAGAKMSYVVSMGRAFDSKRMETFDTMQQLAQGNPQSFPLFADIMFKSSDMAGGDEVAERFHAMLPPQLQKQEGAEDIPPQAKAALAQAQQQTQMMQAELGKLTLEKHAKVVEHQGKMMEIQAKLQADLALEDKKLLTQIAVAEIETKAQILSEREAAVNALESQLHDQAHGLALAQQQHANAQQIAQMQAQNQSAQSAQDAAQQQDAQAQQQQAQPEPAQV